MTPVVHRTPCKQSATLNRLAGKKISLKLENLQKTGSFKVRGAYNEISQLSDEVCANGILAASAGNHAQGVALAGQKRGVPVTVFMPETTPQAKVMATRQYGAIVKLNAARTQPTIAEGIGVKEPGMLTTNVILSLVDEVLTVTEQEIASAILFMLEREKMLVEGAGAAAVAAALAGYLPAGSGSTGIIVSGGNLDIAKLVRCHELVAGLNPAVLSIL
ncbi:threonine ammonia-lyase [Planococcus lenghuensis]|uniref:threonine ammonia-lyase n=1 Tax=Planococcus lenghuensis TaxID=2213202 RepID=A0A1Q2KU90_9BACL|nr:pyridoxal-phosphate dependent enzyme [Planococcus lenghuensis]AQQ51770.1 hypothetical protein B0X71_00610 [Planococcus lenghuensis]